jgi:hypothetical protein
MDQKIKVKESDLHPHIRENGKGISLKKKRLRYIISTRVSSLFY